MKVIVVTLDTFHDPIASLNELRWENNALILVTCDVSQSMMRPYSSSAKGRFSNQRSTADRRVESWKIVVGPVGGVGSIVGAVTMVGGAVVGCMVVGGTVVGGTVVCGAGVGCMVVGGTETGGSVPK
jgi:hypothetical protein